MSKNKKYIFLFVGVVAFLMIFAAILFSQQTQPQKTVTNTTTTSTSNGGYTSTSTNATNQITGAPTSTPTPPEDAAQMVTREFYTNYFSYQINPLANGAYKNSQFISPDFKSIIGALYNNGNTPVFCPQNKAANIVVGQEQKVPYNNTYLLQEVISQAPPGNKDLYRVELKNVNGRWLIFDVNCI